MTSPHDRLFRYTFNSPARAEVLLRHNLPAWLISAVDWSSLRRESGTLADWDRETRKDLLFSARYLLGDERAHEAMKGVLHSIMEAERAEAFMRTMADVLKEQGRRQGLAEGEARGEVRGEARGEIKGEAKGLVKAVLQVLDARGVHVDDASRQRIQSCRDVATLEQWHKRALSAIRISEVLEGPAQ